MANTDAPRGFTPVADDGADLKGKCHWYYKGTTANTILGIGDPVVRIATTTSATDEGVKGEIARHTTGAAITGVIVAIKPDVTNLDRKHLAATDTGYVLVADHPDQVFEVQEVSGGTALTLAAIGNHIDAVAAVNANTTTGRSNYEIDNAAVATDNTFIIVGLAPKPDNAVGEHAKWLVKANLHTDRNASATSITEV